MTVGWRLAQHYNYTSVPPMQVSLPPQHHHLHAPKSRYGWTNLGWREEGRHAPISDYCWGVLQWTVRKKEELALVLARGTAMAVESLGRGSPAEQTRPDREGEEISWLPWQW